MKNKKMSMVDAKKAGYHALRDDMKDLVKEESLDKFKNLRPHKMMKVSVASDSKEGLQKGLSKAEQILKAKMGGMNSPLEAMEKSEPLEEDKELCPECEGEGCEACEMESEAHEAMESEDESPEKLKEKIAELEAKLASLKS